MQSKRNRTSENISVVLVGLLIVMLLILEFSSIQFGQDSIVSDMFVSVISRVLGGIIFSIILISFGYSAIFKARGTLSKTLMVAIPALIVSINNFPFIAHFSGNTEIIRPSYTIYVFILDCLSTGFFEEIIFRGLLFIALLQYLPSNKKGVLSAVFISSAIFAGIHLLNLFYGAAVFPVFLQVGYSFLMGLMWAVVFLKTKNIYVVMLLHAIYNFGGLLYNTLGSIINQFDSLTIIITTILGILVALYYIKIFIELDIEEDMGYNEI